MSRTSSGRCLPRLTSGVTHQNERRLKIFALNSGKTGLAAGDTMGASMGASGVSLKMDKKEEK